MKYLIFIYTALTCFTFNFTYAEVINKDPQTEVVPDSAAGSGQQEAMNKRVKQAPVYPAFLKSFHSCLTKELESCQPDRLLSFFRPANESCSAQGRNLNWFSIKCKIKGKDQVFTATSNEFATIALCMKNKNDRKSGNTLTLYRENGEGPKAYRDFAFFSVGCKLPNGRTMH